MDTQDTYGTLLDKAYEQYKNVAFHLPSRQFGLFKTYLWTAASVIGANTFLSGSETGSVLIASSPCIKPYELVFFYLSSPILALVALVLCLDSLRGRTAHSFPLTEKKNVREWMEYINKKGVNVSKSLAEQFGEASETHNEENQRRAKKLRLISRILSASSILLLFSICYQYIIKELV